MDLDWKNLQKVEASNLPITIIRLYQWDQPTVSVGKHQRAEKAVDLAHCGANGVPVVHRPSGGRAVFHDDEVTYAVASNDPALFPIQSISRTYQVVASALTRGLRTLGIEVELAPGTPSSLPRDAASSVRDTPCFVTPSRHELLYMNRKLVGSAQRRLRRSFLQHGSIPLTIDYDEMGRILGFSVEILRQNIISITEAAGSPIDFAQAAAAFRTGFEQTLGEKTAIP